MAISSTVQPPSAAHTKNIRFIRRGEVVSLANVPNTRTLLEVLREDLGHTGTKEGCGEGDCGACTVVLGEKEGTALRYRAINSCIRMAHSIDGMALWTVEDIAAPDGTLHPAQQAMVENHGSQCGFCTPGFVMSLFGMYQNYIAPTLNVAPTLPTACGSLPPEGAAAPADWQSQIRGPGLNTAGACIPGMNPISRALAQEELSGNLCRCTGYRPILDAAQAMGAWPQQPIDEAALLSLLEQLQPTQSAQQADLGQNLAYSAPRTLPDLLQTRAAHPDAQVVAGCTDVGLWVTKMHMQFGKVLDVTRTSELQLIEEQPGHTSIGAAVRLTDAFAALAKTRPQLRTFATRFAGLPVRNSGTLGGNVANGSPIGDSMPLLIALRASIKLASVRGEREMPLEKLYIGYRKNVMASDELLTCISVPKPAPNENAQVYKISKRYDDDISAVCLAINLQIDGGQVISASIGAGGVAATPVRAVQTEAALAGQPWNEKTVKAAMQVLRSEFSPISDMRASSAYRVQVLGNLLQRYWLESQGMQQINLQSFSLEQAA